MRITRVTVENYKGIVKADIQPPPDLIVIAGPNGTGKTALLEAIAQFKEGIGPYHSVLSVPNAVRLGSPYAQVEVEFEFLPAELEAFAESMRDRGQHIDLAANYLMGEVRIMPDGTMSRIKVDPQLDSLLRFYDRRTAVGVMDYILPYRQMPVKRVQSIALTASDDVEKRRRITEAAAKFQETKDYLVSLLIRDLKHFKDTDQKQDSAGPIRDAFDSLLAPKRLLDVKIGEGDVEVLVDTPGGCHDIDLLSSGEKEVLMVFANLHRLRFTNSILLYEEPELHLNPALEQRLVDNLRRFGANNQIWITTHSTEIADSTDYRNLYLMTLPAGSDNQLKCMSDQAEKLEVFRALGARVGLQLIAEKVVFVEGEEHRGDKEVLGRLFPESSHRIQFVSAGSVNVVTGLSQRISDLLKEASTYSSFYAIRDKDYLERDRVQELRREYNNRLFVLRRYHIENYLLNSVVISQVAGEMGVPALDTPKRVYEELCTIAEDLRENVIAGWAAYDLNLQAGGFDFGGRGEQPLAHLATRAREIHEQLDNLVGQEAVEQLVRAKCDSLAKLGRNWWLTLCPGRELLRRLAGKFFPGLKYVYLRNAIISKMREGNRVPQGLRQIMAEILNG